MKKIFLTGIILLGLLFTNQTQAQISVGIKINIGSQPGWGPIGYDYVDYYYLPDIDVYYSVPTHEYIYLSGGRWYATTFLPAMYASFDFYNAYKVVINGIAKPWLRAGYYRRLYASYKGRGGQQFIYGYPDHKYNNYYKGDNRHQPRPPQHYNPPKPPQHVMPPVKSAPKPLPAPAPNKPGNHHPSKPGKPGHGGR